MTGGRRGSALSASVAVGFAMGLMTLSLNALGADTETSGTSATPLTSVSREEPPKFNQLRQGFYSLGATAQHYDLHSDDDNELRGFASAISLGRGHITSRWYLLGGIDILLGPFEPMRKEAIGVDFLGTGFSLWYGYNLRPLDMRNRDGALGLALGLTYADIVGRSLRNKRGQNMFSGRQISGLAFDDTSSTSDSGYRITEYTIRVTNLAIQPSLFYAWLREGRPEGNSPELLTTRLEGIIMTFGVSIPIIANYTARYDREFAAPSVPADTQKESGRFKGSSIFMAVATLLGV